MSDVATALEAAIEQVIREHESGMVIKWLCVVDGATAEGDRHAWTSWSSGTPSWDLHGLIARASSDVSTVEETEDDD